MRVLVIAPSWEQTPPKGHGPGEHHAATLARELTRRGHDVVVFATGDSEPGCPLAWEFATAGVEPHGEREHLHIQAAMRFAARGDFDVVHSNESNAGLLLIGQLPIPSLTRMNWPGSPHLKAAFRGLPLGQQRRTAVATVSANLSRRVSFLGPTAVIYNGIDVAPYAVAPKPDGPLLFLGRICPEKGPHIAARIAYESGREIVLAGPITNKAYFDAVLKPWLDAPHVTYLGPVDFTGKLSLYAEACALVMPYQWEEPFGNVMIEAMACGLPCIAFDNGSPREIIAHGQTGYVVRTESEAVNAVGSLDQIRPSECRRQVERRFSVEAMVDRYVEQYQQLMEQYRREDKTHSP